MDILPSVEKPYVGVRPFYKHMLLCMANDVY